MATYTPVTIVADLEEFIGLHGKHGRPTPDVGPLMPNGYRLEVVCPCRVTFERWVTPEDAALELAVRHLRAEN
jgi:hypothetical protein